MNHTIVITTVGTSMFSNYFDNFPRSQHKDTWDDIKKMPFTENDWSELEGDNSFKEFKKEVQDNWTSFSCAELDTIEAIKTNYGQNLEHHLLCSETIAGYLAGQILKAKLVFATVTIIEKLQTKIAGGFKEVVFLKLVGSIQDLTENMLLEKRAVDVLSTLKKNKIKDFKEKELEETGLIEKEPFNILFTKATQKTSWKDHIESERVAQEIVKIQNKKVVISYSGGYKAIIPYLTVLGQLYNYDLAYMHEDSEELIDTKRLPFNFDVSLAEQYYPYLTVLDEKEKENQSLNQNVSVKLSKEKVLEKAKSQIEQMKVYQLLDGQNEVTAFGKLILNYINETNAIGKTTLGFYCEYKMFEYFYEYHRNDYSKIERSFEPIQDDANNPGIAPRSIGDADLRLDVAHNSFDWVEIKSFGGVFEIDKNGEFRVIQRTRDRHAYKTSNFKGSHIHNYKFIIYKYESDDLALISDIIAAMKEEFTNVQVYYFTIKLSDISPFRGFMQNKLAQTDLIQL